MVATKLTAKLIIIGSEILSGKVQDANIVFLASSLRNKGISLKEVRIISDDEAEIVNTVRELKNNCDFLFTSGGLGPTHDDITLESISKALKVPYEIHKDAFQIIEEYYKKKNIPFNQARQRMAWGPRGSTLIPNDISTAPGYHIENIYMLAGVPSIFQNMLDNLIKDLPNLEQIFSETLELLTAEGNIAFELTEVQKKYAQVEIGSYPFEKNKSWGTNIVFTSTDQNLIKQALAEFKNKIK